MKHNSYLKGFFLIVTVFSLLFGGLQGMCFCMGGEKVEKRADAVNLLIEKVYDVKGDGSYTLTLHLKAKVLTYKGKKDLADFRMSYNKGFQDIKIIDAKTISETGKVTKVTQKEIQDISDPSTQSVSIFSASRVKVINFPSVEKGSIVEFTLKKHSKLGFWGAESFSLENPTHIKRVKILLPKDMSLKFHINSKEINFKKKSEKGLLVYEWIGKDLEKLPSDPLMPPVLNLDKTLVFSSFDSWNKVKDFFVKRLFNRYESIDSSALPTKIEGPITKKDIPGTYGILIRDFGIFPISFFSSTLSFSSPERILKRRLGSQMELLILFHALLKNMGEKPDIVAINTAGALLEALKDVPSPGFFDSFYLKVNNSFFSFDRKELPPGITGHDGEIALSLDSGKFLRIKDAVKKSTQRTFKVIISSPGTYKANFLQKDFGINSLPVKRIFKYLTKKEYEVRRSMFYHSLFPRAKPVTDLSITGLDDLSCKTSIETSFSVKDFLIENNGLYCFPFPGSAILSRIATLPRERRSDLFIKSSNELELNLQIDFPKRSKIEIVPRASKGKIGPLSWELFCAKNGNKVSCTRSLKIKRGIVKNGDEFLKLRQAAQRLLFPYQNSIFYSEPINSLAGGFL